MSKVVVTPPKIDTDLFRPGPKYENLIVSVGRLSPEKNHSTLILAAAELPWALLLIVGDGPLRPQLTRLAGAVGRRVDVAGTMANSEVAKVLGQATYFVLPSLYDQSPKVVWEAMASECACIVSAQVGVVEDGVTGWLCEPSVCGISTAIERAKKDPRRQAICQAARMCVFQATKGDLSASIL
ncbi:MAG TPA: glycosyltransferase family 4 protein [Anaerolineales bacterium]|nr:glycosyltransferase family 4 protein [Anaerolineales bacterium]